VTSLIILGGRRQARNFRRRLQRERRAPGRRRHSLLNFERNRQTVGNIGGRNVSKEGRPVEKTTMGERRRSTRDPTYLAGVIYFNHGRDSLSCVIHDYSYEGARIVIFDPINVPDEVELHIPERNRLVHATVRWRHGDKIGLAFSEARPASGKARSAERLHARL
jgi:hypothetical protein